VAATEKGHGETLDVAKNKQLIDKAIEEVASATSAAKRYAAGRL